MNSGLFGAALVETALVTYREVGQGRLSVPGDAPLKAPLPSTYTAIVVVYGVLGFVPGQGELVASLIGWGLVIATFLNLWQPGSKSVTGLGGTSTPTLNPASAPVPAQNS